MNFYVLDACALLALLHDESGADKVAAAIIAANNGEAEIVMNRINLLEVYYDVYRSRGEEQAKVMVANLKKHRVEINAEITDKIFAEAGRLKASYKISLADSIALAQAIVTGGELLTADHHEFDVIEADGREAIRFCWIR
jgi:predicted nucleic acid-binding protein